MKKNFVVYYVLLIVGLIGVTLGIAVPNAVVSGKNTYTATSTTSLIEGKNYNVDIALNKERDISFVRIKFNSNFSLVSKDKDYTIDYPASDIKINGRKIHINIVLDEATDILKMGLIQDIKVFDTSGNEIQLENAEWKVPTIICVAGSFGILSAVTLILLIVKVSKVKKTQKLLEELSSSFADLGTKNISLQELISLKKGVDAKDFEQDYFENKNEMIKIVQKYDLKKKD